MQNVIEFINWYYNEDDNFFITLINNKTGAIRNYYHNKETFFKNLKQISYTNYNYYMSLYFSINGFKEKEECELNIYNQAKKTKSNVDHIKSLVFDFDEPETSKMDCANLIETLDMIPSYILETSKNKYQVCYKLNETDIDFKKYELINKTLAKKFRSDINVCSIEKVFRMPFSINHKNKFQCRFIKTNPSKSYNFSTFEDKLNDYMSNNAELKKFYEEHRDKNKAKTPRPSKMVKFSIKKPRKPILNSFNYNSNTELDPKNIKKYKMLLKFNNDDASIVDILYIRERSKLVNSYDEIFNEIVAIRDLLDKPIKRELDAYYLDREQFFESVA